MIRVEKLSKNYGSVKALDRVDLHFEAGVVHGIVGENGAGKTTLFRCMAGLESYEGEVKSDVAVLKEHLGYLMTESFFFSKITGREYVRLLCQARGVEAEEIDERNIFELPLDRYASTYSTGMRKKLAILAILMQENRYLILDEPFNGLDIESNMLITEIILKLKDLGKTVIISSHIFSTLSEVCDRISVLEAGRVVKEVDKEGFTQLESEMKEVMLSDRIDRLGLR